MSRADLEAAAAEKYPVNIERHTGDDFDMNANERAAYIQGRLDQAEADARIAEQVHAYRGSVEQWAAREIAAAIGKGVE